MRGYVGPDLVDAVPTIRAYSLASLPRGLCSEDVEKTLASVDRERPIGKRDYAALLLLATYGLRIGEVVRLRVEDIDWRRDRISFSQRKAGGPLVLPLTREVGEALITYLREARPAAAHPEVFLCAKGEPRPLGTHCAGLRVRLKQYMACAGINRRMAIPHALRHSLASRLLEKDEPLEVIAGLLGQSSLWSTFTYAKADIDHLREVALDLPEVRS
jgi:integrase